MPPLDYLFSADSAQIDRSGDTTGFLSRCSRVSFGRKDLIQLVRANIYTSTKILEIGSPCWQKARMSKGIHTSM